ncbi:MAG: hypothetical protein AAF705_02370, partial [Bacteroidota bacterium]
SEYIIGDWELREVIDPTNYKDTLYHDLGPDYTIIYRFQEDQTYIFSSSGRAQDPVSFSVNEMDSILILGTTSWQLYSFDENELDIRIWSRNEPTGLRFYKIE